MSFLATIHLLAILRDSEPILVPAVLLLCGLVAALLASIHSRRKERIFKGRSQSFRFLGRVALVGYLLVSISAFSLAGIEIFTRWQLFWSAHWENGQSTLVLERWGPIPDIRIAKSELVVVTEFSVVERSLSGHRRSVQFVVRTDDGNVYWSGPLRRPVVVALTRRLLSDGTGGRLERFVVGNDAQFH